MTFKTLWKICEQNDLEKLKKQNRKKLINSNYFINAYQMHKKFENLTQK